MTSTMSHCWVRTLCAWVCNKCVKYHHISKVLYLDVKYLAIFLPVWTRVKNSRDSNRAFLVCGNAPNDFVHRFQQIFFLFFLGYQ